jgi:arylsulfatase A-like enzyme
VSQPNILFFLPDQHRPDWLPDNGALPLRMPNLAGMVARGTRFTRAVTPSPLCAPARACLASGRAYGRSGVANNGDDLPPHTETYYRRLRDAGYTVAGVGKFDLHKATLDWGLDGRRLLPEWGFSDGVDSEGKLDAVRSGADAPAGPYMAYLHREGLAASHVEDFRRRAGGLRGYTATHPTPLPDEAYGDNWIASNGLRQLESFPRERPWHLVVNFTGPHNPMDVTAAMLDGWSDEDFPPPAGNDQVDRATHVRIRRNYAAMLENIDRHMGRFLDAVAARGETERTLVVYASDHGEMLGEHNLWGKSVPYQPSIGIPLIVAGPGVRRGAASDALVSLHDLAPTFVESAAAPPLPASPDEADGRSLWPLLSGAGGAHRGAVRSALRSANYDWRLAFDGRYKLVEAAGAAPRLYDLEADPGEDVDLAARCPAEVARLTPALSAAPAGPPRPPAP